MGNVFYEDDDATFVAERNLTVGLYRGCPNVTHIRILRAQFARQLKVCPQGVAILVSIHCHGWIPRFDDAFRSEVNELVRETERGSLGSAFVLTGHGMVTSGLRAFINGIFLLSNSREPNRAFRDLASAVEWLGALPGIREQWSKKELLDVGLSFGVGSSLLQRTG